ncbi:unnamed protein product [Allacma fusca]|uniref:Uncharacterized protein n=1 Tax=Allacma fusca TaxID=39272 RepID=A0A8J2PFE2_9HEXA|nr:unnamed protein product [Allacma fusca]
MDDDYLDPRIQVELEKLNNATNDINNLEKELDNAQEEFRITLSKSTAELNKLIQKFGNSIELSRPFYEALKEAKSAHRALHETTVLFQRANVIHEDAKNRVSLTEEKLKSGDGFDDGLQEILNIATLKVTESNKTKQDFSRLHKKLTDEFTQCEKNVYNLEKKLCKHIQKSQPYFELTEKLNAELNSIKEKIQALQRKLIQSKCDYSSSLKKLEFISEEIHYQRQAQNNNYCIKNNNIENNYNNHSNNRNSVNNCNINASEND